MSSSWGLRRVRVLACVCCLLASISWSAWSSCDVVPLGCAFLCLMWLLRVLFVSSQFKRSCECGVRALVILGSGGHTAEMMTMMNSLSQQSMHFSSVVYAVATSDGISRFKAENSGIRGEFVTVPRAREVGQSYASSTISTAHAFLHSFICVVRYQPQLLLCNGPAICVPFAIAAAFCRQAPPTQAPWCSEAPSHQLFAQVLRGVPLLRCVR
jgi:hypothetical protein